MAAANARGKGFPGQTVGSDRMDAQAVQKRTVVWTEVVSHAASQRAPDGTLIPAMPVESWGGPYSAMMDFLLRGGFLESLPLDARKLLLVSVPFCGHFMECPLLCPFLAQFRLQVAQGCLGASLLATDTQRGASWSTKEEWVRRTYRNMVLQCLELDLGSQPLPKCSLSLGIHPEATRKEWQSIIANVSQSLLPGGVAVFATYFQLEAGHVQHVAASAGLALQIFENPYYKGRTVNSGAPSLRFLLVGRSARAAP